MWNWSNSRGKPLSSPELVGNPSGSCCELPPGGPSWGNARVQKDRPSAQSTKLWQDPWWHETCVTAVPNKCCKHMKRLSSPLWKKLFDNHYTKHSEASLRLPHLGLSCKQICLKNEILWRFQKPSPFEVLPCVESQAVDKFITTFQSISKALRDPTGIFTLENLHKLIRNPQNE